MLPGVECARRRRFHQSGDSPSTLGNGSTRRPTFCLYTSNHDTQFLSSSSSNIMQRSSITYLSGYEDDKLGDLAREAKERLDERLRTKGKSANKGNSSFRNNVEDSTRLTRIMSTRESQRGIFGSKKNGKGSNNNSSISKLQWNATEQDECTICLDQFKANETLVSLSCAHRFHSTCLVPWLESNSHCPCCRMCI